MTTTPVTLTIAPSGAVCRVCGGACGGQWAQAGPDGWHYHADARECVRVTLGRIREAAQ